MMCLYLLRDRNQSTSLWCHFLPLWPVCLSVCLPSLCVFHHPCLSIVWVRVCACLNAAALVNLFLPMSVSSPSVPNNGLCSLFCWTTQKASHGEKNEGYSTEIFSSFTMDFQPTRADPDRKHTLLSNNQMLLPWYDSHNIHMKTYTLLLGWGRLYKIAAMHS